MSGECLALEFAIQEDTKNDEPYVEDVLTEQPKSQHQKQARNRRAGHLCGRLVIDHAGHESQEPGIDASSALASDAKIICEQRIARRDDFEKAPTPVELAPIAFTFGRHGRFQLSSLCARLTARYTYVDRSLRFLTSLVPRSTCKGPLHELTSEESAVVAALGTVTTFELNGNYLELFAADGRLMLQMVSAGQRERPQKK